MDKLTKIQLLANLHLVDTMVDRMYNEEDSVTKAEWLKIIKMTIAETETKLDDVKSEVYEQKR